MAALPLFIDIIVHPVGTQAQINLELLVSAASILRSIPSRALTPYELEHAQETNEFMMELVRLGSCAIELSK